MTETETPRLYETGPMTDTEIAETDSKGRDALVGGEYCLDPIATVTLVVDGITVFHGHPRRVDAVADGNVVWTAKVPA